MQFLENFILAHPFLLSEQLDRYLLIFLELVFASIGCCAAYRLPKKPSQKYFRFGAAIFSLVFFVQAFGNWRYPKLNTFLYPRIQTPLIFVTWLLFIVYFYFEIRDRQAAKNRSDYNDKN